MNHIIIQNANPNVNPKTNATAVRYPMRHICTPGNEIIIQIYM